jgi:conjugative transposon TraN protein
MWESALAQAPTVGHLEISMAKTTLIVSHYQIRSVDRGSRDIMVQKVKGVDTVLEVKAARNNFPETNLTIITGDGAVHMFLVVYNPDPSILWYPLSSVTRSMYYPHSESVQPELTESGFELLSDSILQQPVHFRRVADRSYGVSAALAGIYIHEEVLFFRLRMKNSSHISYNINQLNFYIRDKRQSKRTASQDLPMSPLSIKGSYGRLVGKSSLDFTVALSKFTIPNKKLLYVVFKEKNGGRLLRLKIKNRLLIRAKEI